MRPIVCDDGREFDEQTRAYAEYRVFSALAGRHAAARGVTVTLARQATSGVRGDQACLCTIAVVVGSGDRVEVDAVEAHPYAAIDRAAALIAAAIARCDRCVSM